MAEIARGFEELAIFQKARELSKKVYELTWKEPFKFDMRFVQQIRAASGSVMDNIAEGYERNGNKEFINFLYIAKGSCGEVRSQFIRAHDVRYIDDTTFTQLYTECKKLSASIMNFIKDLRSKDMKGAKYAYENGIKGYNGSIGSNSSKGLSSSKGSSSSKGLNGSNSSMVREDNVEYNSTYPDFDPDLAPFEPLEQTFEPLEQAALLP